MKLFKGKVIAKNELNKGIIHLVVKPDTEITFKSGQYFSFRIEPKINRSYSVFSAPHKENLEFLIDTAPQGVGSKFAENLAVGDEFDLMGPLGFFNLEDTKALESECPLIFIATGTGIAPMYSMIEDLLINQKSKRPLQLFFGLRYLANAYLFEELKTLEATYPNFKFTPVISQPESKWTGEKGHCQDCLTKVPHIADGKIYICGSNQAVKGITDDLLNYGYAKEQLFFEKFG